MTNSGNTPRQYLGVMVSSTFTDLQNHRAALIKAIDSEGLKAVVMENDSAKPGVDVIESSLQMVRDASAYIGLISHKYGQTPHNLSLTELEFNEAEHQNRPILLFIMGDDHPVPKRDVEKDPARIAKLDAFRERAKLMKPDSQVHRVYDTFNSLEEFNTKAIHAVAGLRRHLDAQATPQPEPQPSRKPDDPLPTPPAFYAEPPYIGSHQFLGRQAELNVLSDWALPADTHPVLLFEAIGGTGKSMLTWEWTTNHAMRVRTDWAGRFWYSFYERGAIMADFCRRALAYITGQPPQSFNKIKTPELAERLLHHLRDRPWLLVLDGLERVLVAYHRIDAAELRDEEANQPTDQIAERDPCTAIRPEDDDLLRALAAAGPSKLLITSRLIPRVLLNQSSQPIPGVRRVSLPGLRPADAEALFRSCGITGDSQAIRNYLSSHCDCHPLVTGILAGLINDYMPDRGNFDAWAADPAAGGQLNLADLDLVQKRNHILKAAIAGVPQKSRQLLSVLALLSEAVDAATLSALNTDPRDLANTVKDLERRGLLQYDGQSKRYDLHPVVRGIAAGGLRPEERNAYGQRVIDHFSGRTHSPYDDAETLEDLRDGLHIVRTLLKMGRYQEAYEAYVGDLSNALSFNLEANSEAISLLRSFSTEGWATLPPALDERARSYLTNDAAIALASLGEPKQALLAFGAALASDLKAADWSEAGTRLRNISVILSDQKAQQDRCLALALDLGTLSGEDEAIFLARWFRFSQLAKIGRWVDAKATWDLLNPMGRAWSRALYRPGNAEYHYACFRFWLGDLREEHLTQAEELAKTGKNRMGLRYLHGLRGEWRLDQGDWALAAESLQEAVSMARAVGQTDPAAEAQLALARFHQGQLTDQRGEAEQLANAREPFHRGLADLWLAIGDQDQAKKHALAAYKRAWADGEPYAHHYELNKARALLEKLGAEIPNLTPYDPAKDGKFPYEDEVLAAIEKLRAEKEAQARQ